MRHLIFLSLIAFTARADEAKLYLQFGHAGQISSAAFSPDGRLIVTGGYDNTVRLWDVASGRELGRFEGHSATVNALAFSPDGRAFLTGSEDGTARLWDPLTGNELRRFGGSAPSGPNSKAPRERIQAVAFSRDGKSILTAGTAIRIWDLATGSEIRRIDKAVNDATFSPDGNFILVASNSDKIALLFEAGTGREIRRFEGHTENVTAAGFSPDGRSILTGAWDGTARLWDAATAREIRRFDTKTQLLLKVAFSPDAKTALTFGMALGDAGPRPSITESSVRLWEVNTGKEFRRVEATMAAGFSPDGRDILSGFHGDAVRIWDQKSGDEIRRFERHVSPAICLSLSRDGSTVLLASASRTASLWDLRTGRQSRVLQGTGAWINAAALSPDGRQAVIVYDDATTRIWDMATGREIGNIKGERLKAVTFSPDGKSIVVGGDILLTAMSSGIARLFDLTPREIRRFNIVNGEVTGYGEGVRSAAFSPDGRYVVTGGSGFDVPLWEVATGKRLRLFRGHGSPVNAVAFSPDGRSVLTGGQDSTARLWDVETGRETARFQNHSLVASVTFAPDGRSVLTDGWDNVARLWDVTTQQEIRRFEGFSNHSGSIAFSPDGRFVFIASNDGATRLWDVSTGKLLAVIASFTDGSWATVDPEGRYDASDPDHTDSLYWRTANLGVIGLAQLRRSFYTPGLLANIMRQSPLPPVQGLNQIANLPPKVTATTSGDAAHPVLQVRLERANRGVSGRVVVRVNGRPFAAKPVSQTAKPVSQTNSDGVELLQYSLADAHLDEGENVISVTAFSADNLIESNPATTTLKQETAVRGVTPAVPRESAKTNSCAGRFYGIIVGTGTFPFAQSLNLRYPENDAQALAAAIRLGAESLCGKDRVEILTLTSNNPDAAMQPTKQNIRHAFETVAAKSTRKDLLFVYLAGHGAAPASDPHAYFYLTQDARQVNVDIADKLRDSTTVSSAELVQWLTIPNLPDKQVLILDTCAAGAANAQLASLANRARSAADDLKKAVDNWNIDTGTYILMGSATDRASYESDRFHHGLLTYALLRGMKGEALLDNSRLEAGHWFEIAIPAVEKYAAMIGRDQKPQKAVPTAAGGVPVGFFSEPTRNQIPLLDPAPAILKLTVCLDEGTFTDRLQLAVKVRSELRALTNSTTRGATVTYDDNNTETSPGALTPQVRYHADRDQLKLTVALLQGDTKAAETSLSIPLADVQSAAQQVARALLKLAESR